MKKMKCRKTTMGKKKKAPQTEYEKMSDLHQVYILCEYHHTLDTAQLKTKKLHTKIAIPVNLLSLKTVDLLPPAWNHLYPMVIIQQPKKISMSMRNPSGVWLSAGYRSVPPRKSGKRCGSLA